MRARTAVLVGVALLAGCGKKMDSGDTTKVVTTDTAAPASLGAAERRIARAVAFVFAQSFRLPGAVIDPVYARPL